MSDKVKVTAFATVDCEARTLGDLRELVKWCDEHDLPDRLGLDLGSGFVYVEITGDTAVRAEMIECGDHRPPKIMFDVLVPTHSHGPETYEEALEEALDRYADERRPE